MARGWICTVMLRRFSAHFFKTAILLFIVSFLWLQLRIVSLKPDLFIYHRNKYSDQDLAFFANFSAIVNSVNTTLPENIQSLYSTVQDINMKQVIYNSDKFSPLQPKDVIIVVQVHNRAQYLYALIESLKQSRFINETLLVFSHDLYDIQINALIQRIDFAKVIQVFYPNSIQMHPNEFPGHDPNDCPRNMKKEEAVLKKCNNAKYPDLYGHYREAKFTQTKHHWWWKVNHVMDGLHATQDHVGPVLLLEEDHYVAPDFLYMLQMMEDLRETKYPQCNILCLGSYVKTYNYASFSKQVEIVKWLSSKHNMGMVVNRTLWHHIKKCAKAFCSFDDYNWDWSLQHVSATCMSSPLTAMVAVAPRVFHIGECSNEEKLLELKEKMESVYQSIDFTIKTENEGIIPHLDILIKKLKNEIITSVYSGVHHRGKDCSSDKVVHKVVRVLTSSKTYLFPPHLTVRQSFRKPFKAPKGNGGWGDLRDHNLCFSQVKNVTTSGHS